MRFLIDDVFPEGLARRTDLAKTRIFLAIGEKNAGHSHTRSSLAPILSLRPATVSAMVAELIEDGLVIEGRKIAPPRKGRPEVPLTIETRRILTVVIDIVSRNLKGALIDLGGTVVAATGIALDVEEADQATILSAFSDIVKELIGCAPRGTQLAGIGVAPARHRGRQRAALESRRARWPHIAGLDFGALEVETGLPVRIESRSAKPNCARCCTARRRNGPAACCCVNWGYGISSAFRPKRSGSQFRHGRFRRFRAIGSSIRTVPRNACAAKPGAWKHTPRFGPCCRRFAVPSPTPRSIRNRSAISCAPTIFPKFPKCRMRSGCSSWRCTICSRASSPDRIILSGQVLKNLWVA